MSNFEKYVNAFVTGLGIERDGIEDLTYQSIEAWDSVGHMNLITAIEDAFDIMMDTDDIIELSSFDIGKKILADNYDIVF